MAPEWEAAAAMGAMDLGMGIHHAAYHHNMAAAAVPMSHHHGGFSHVPAAAAAGHHHFYGAQAAAGDHLRVDQLLDLSNAGAAHDFFPGGGADAHHAGGAPASSEPSPVASSGSFNLSFAADDYYIPVPSEEAAELEWLSNFVDDSYPDMPNYPPEVQAAIAAGAAAQQQQNSSSSSAAAAAPGRGARSKRSRATSAAAAAWRSLVPSSAQQQQQSSPSSSSDSKAAVARSGSSSGRKSGGGEAGGAAAAEEGGVRRCTHCASERTPQWRTGPLGPKTLCNACGVRYKSGRLVPEYRPAASPTFVLTQHSNSHRKVMELRRQKELLLLRGNASGSTAAAAAAAELMFRDYGVC
ncbi:hypothetical protein ACP4OV_022472 [Aristida adscensionis]